jgi:4-hydroxy-2-oxoheptanedioate aldolase
MPEAKGPQIGTVVTLPGAIMAELLADPFDLVWVDLEHGALGWLDAQEAILGAQAAGTIALVRLPADAFPTMTSMLDAGADGIVLADVRDAEVARVAIDRMKHPPHGSRGWGPRRLMLRGRLSASELPAQSVSVQIESAEGVENAAEIAAVEGLDAIVVGTADLSFSLGSPLDMGAPDLLEAIDSVREAARVAGVRFGLAGAIDGLPAQALAGAEMLVHSTDARICASAVDAVVARMRDLAPGGIIEHGAGTPQGDRSR